MKVGDASTGQSMHTRCILSNFRHKLRIGALNETMATRQSDPGCCVWGMHALPRLLLWLPEVIKPCKAVHGHRTPYL